ncbi:MAG TPA: hypothetical protein VIM79_25655 [Niastella sp.]
MQSYENICQKIAHVEDRLKLIYAAIEKEKERPFFERRKDLCRFLDIEKRIYNAILKELNWIVNE